MTDLRSAGPFRSTLLLLMVGLFAWGVGAALAPLVSTWVLVAMAFLAAVEAQASWRVVTTASPDRGQRRLIRAIEIVIAFFVAKSLHLLFFTSSALADGSGLFDGETIAAWLLAIVVWVATTNSVADLERLGDPPQPSRGYRPPLQSITRRFLTGVIAQVGIGVASVVSVADLSSFERSVVATWFWPAVAYLSVGLLVIGTVRRQDTRLRWERERVVVEADVHTRWAASLSVVLLLAFLAAIFVPVLGGGRVLDATFGGMVGAGRWFRDVFSQDAGSTAAAVPAQTIPPRPTTTLAAATEADGISSAGPGILELLVSVTGLALALMLIASVIAVLMRGSPRLRGMFSRGRWRGILRLLWLALSFFPRLIIKAINALFSWYRRVAESGTKRRRSRTGYGDEGLGGIESRWGVGDRTRVEIGRIYGQFLERAGNVLAPRETAQTPVEYSAQVARAVAPAGVESLTATFNEARYSTHPLGSDQVESAREALEAISDALEALDQET